jgi:hypothetical protein
MGALPLLGALERGGAELYDLGMARPRGRPSENVSLLISREPLIEELQAACRAGHLALAMHAAERNRQLEDTFFRAAASLEGFLSDWFVRCLSFDADRFGETFELRAQNHATDALNAWNPSSRLWKRRGRQPFVTVGLPNRLALESTRGRRVPGLG